MDVHKFSHTKKFQLHSQAFEILFSHKKEVDSLFSNILGIQDLRYASLIIINPQNELVIFSSEPSMEFNLIVNHFWEVDPCLRLSSFIKNPTISWNDVLSVNRHNAIHQYRLANYHYNSGLTRLISKNNFHFLFSCAALNNSCQVEIEPSSEQLAMYCIKLFAPLYEKYNRLQSLNDVFHHESKNKNIRLVIDNSQKKTLIRN